MNINKWRMTFRPAKPEWDNEGMLDLDSLCKTVEILSTDAALAHYIKGWLDTGYHLLDLEKVVDDEDVQILEAHLENEKLEVQRLLKENLKLTDLLRGDE